MKSICFITLPFPGVLRVGEEGQKLGFWNLVTLIYDEKPAIPVAQVYILGAWDNSYIKLIEALPDESKIGVCFTSSVGEVDATPVEWDYLWQIEVNPRIDFLWFGDDALSRISKKGKYAPYPIAYQPAPEAPKLPLVTLFCPPKITKNIANQIVAMKIVQQSHDLTLHTNVQGYEFLLSKVRHVKHPWLPPKQYASLLASAKLNLAVSWSETNNYQVVEALLLGTPSIISAAVPIPGYQVLQPDDPAIIALGIDQALKVTNATYFQKQLKEISEIRNQLLSGYLKSL